MGTDYSGLNHSNLQANIIKILVDNEIKHTLYADEEDATSYPLIGGKSIKLWNIFPHSGDRLDRTLYQINRFLELFDLIAVLHVYTRPQNRLLNAIVPQKRGPNIACKAFVDVPTTTVSILVKPIPKDK